MKLLILTQVADHHSIAVEKVLAAQGHQVDRIFSANLPLKNSYTFELNNHVEYSSCIFEDESAILLNHDVIWLRRLPNPYLGSLKEHADFEFIKLENGEFLRNIVSSSSSDAVWINSAVGREQSEAKALQLRIAEKVGLNVPKTLISNSPTEIKSFLSSGPQRSIYKPFFPNVWSDGENIVAKARAVPIRLPELPDDDLLRLTPGIFQERLNKDFEVRVSIFGEYPVAAKIDSQKHKLGTEDWRNIPYDELPVTQISLPDDIFNMCVKLMRELEIKVGFFDFIVKDEKWTFLEVNQMGQFLWIENVAPEIRLLSIFCQFLVSLADDKPFSPVDDGVQLNDVLDQPTFKAITAEELANHHSHYNQPGQYWGSK